MRISQYSHHFKKTSLWDHDNQEAEAELTTDEIVSKAIATIRASFKANTPRDLWVALGQYLQKCFFQHSATRITSFGTFGFDENDDPMFVQDPVFLHMTRCCLKRDDREPPTSSSSENAVEIDLNDIADEYGHNCSTDLVKSLVSNVFACVAAWAKDGKEMQLSFSPVGEWVCRGDSVRFHFSNSFCKQLQLRRAECKSCSDSGDNIENEENHPDSNQSAVSPLSARTIASDKTLHSKRGSDVAVDSLVLKAKNAETRSASSTGRSQYGLCAPTLSSIAKRLPPRSQRYVHTETVVKRPTTRSTDKTNKAKSVAGRYDRKQARSVSSSVDAADTNIVTHDILAATKPVRPSTAFSSHICGSEGRTDQTSCSPAQEIETITRLRSRISNRRNKTMQGLNAIVVVFSRFKTSAISSAELSLSLRKLGVKISSAELKEIAAVFAHEKRGYIDTSKLLDALRGPPLSAARLEWVTRAFHTMDPVNSGAVHIDELIKHYDVGHLPQVRDGKQSRLKAITTFLQEWTLINPAATNFITFEIFVEYYHNLSACIEKDDAFAQIMRQAWQIPDKKEEQEGQLHVEEDGKSGGSTTSFVRPAGDGTPSPISSHAEHLARNLETSAESQITIQEKDSPSKTWSYLRSLLLFPDRYQFGASSWPTLDNMCRRLGANRVLGNGNETMNVKAFAYALIALDKRLSQKKAGELSKFVADSCVNGPNNVETIELLSLYRALMTIPNETSIVEAPLDDNCAEHCASRVIERIRARVQESNHRTDKGSLVDLTTLEKWLRTSGSSGDAHLLKHELRSALLKVGINISYQDLDHLFAYFDTDRQGFINYETLLESIRCPSKMLLIRAKRQDSSLITIDVQPRKDPASDQSLLNQVYPVAPQIIARRTQHIARMLRPDYRRRNHIYRAIWDQSKREAVDERNANCNELELERGHRYQAAQVIQTVFRRFRARQLVAQLRRKAIAKSAHCSAVAQEQQQLLAKKARTTRTTLSTTYGF